MSSMTLSIIVTGVSGCAQFVQSGSLLFVVAPLGAAEPDRMIGLPNHTVTVQHQ